MSQPNTRKQLRRLSRVENLLAAILILSKLYLIQSSLMYSIVYRVMVVATIMTLGLVRRLRARTSEQAQVAALFQMPNNIIGLNNEKLISANDKLFVRRAIFV